MCTDSFKTPAEIPTNPDCILHPLLLCIDYLLVLSLLSLTIKTHSSLSSYSSHWSYWFWQCSSSTPDPPCETGILWRKLYFEGILFRFLQRFPNTIKYTSIIVGCQLLAWRCGLHEEIELKFTKKSVNANKDLEDLVVPTNFCFR